MLSNNYYSFNLPLELIKLVTPYCFITLRGEADFYGASYLIAKKNSLNSPPKSYSSWSHGVEHANLKFIDQVIWNKKWVYTHLVRNLKTFQFLEKSGVDKLNVIGMPIIYVDGFNVTRKKNSLLVMLAHTLSTIDMDMDTNEIIQFTLALREKDIYVCFCVHKDCKDNGLVTSQLDKNNIDWFVGSAANDANSLQRMRNIFEYFETVSSNAIGSQFFYSQLFGAKFFFLEPYFEYRAEWFKHDPFWGDKRDMLDYSLEQSSQKTIMKKHPEYFRGYSDAVCNQQMAANECGIQHKREPAEIAKMLGWGIFRQTLCAIKNGFYYIKMKVLNVYKRITQIKDSL